MPVQGSAGAAAALSLCLVLGGSLLEGGEVAVTGYVDLRGNMLPVGVRQGPEDCLPAEPLDAGMAVAWLQLLWLR